MSAAFSYLHELPMGVQTAQNEPESFDVAVIGGGFAGTVVAVQLARLAQRPLRVVMFDRTGAFGRGAAYSPASDHCLLNVRAKAMGAFPDLENDFLHWLRDNGYGSDDPDLGERFLPRRLYGAYLCSLLDGCTAGGVSVERRHACISGLAPVTDGCVLTTVDGSRTVAKTVVLAIGNLPPGGFGDAALSAAMTRYACNPWDLLAGVVVDRDADVAIIGTGLSALDILLQLAANEHRGRIMMLSRHGRFPLAHAPPSAAPAAAIPLIVGKPRTVLRVLRRLVRDAASNGHSWHAVVDALRPQINRIWQTWTPNDQRQFYRHLASIWEIHRHRAPQSSLAIRDALIETGQLHVHRGRLTALAAIGERRCMTYAERDSGIESELHADIVVDCTGPRRDMRNSGDALIEAVFARKLAQPGSLGLGFEAAADGTLSGSTSLYALGTPLRGTLCESSAVREIRVQARAIAENILAATTGSRRL